MRVFVLDAHKQPLMPCRPARARELLKNGQAAVYLHYPFTIILLKRIGGNLQPVECKLDPGSKKTGIALVGAFKKGRKLIFAAELEHRKNQIRDALLCRRSLRRARRSRKLPYRASRFNNRVSRRMFAPSMQSVLNNMLTWVKRLSYSCPFSIIAVESARFDMQKLIHPEISGVEYAQGTLIGYEIREYLLTKFQHTCAYCGVKEIPLEIDHVQPRSLGGSDRVNNLVISCRPCNLKKGNQLLSSFLKDANRLKVLYAQLERPLDGASCVNTLRKELITSLQTLSFTVISSTGAMTKYHRLEQGYPKAHWIDAACVGPSGKKVHIPPKTVPISIKAMGRGIRQMCRVDKYGFPRTSSKHAKRIHSFQTGDLVKARVLRGNKTGSYLGRVAVRTSGFFNIQTLSEVIQGIHARDCKRLQHTNGYQYKLVGERIPPTA